MIHLSKRYFINFWIWWYAVEHKVILLKLIGIWMHSLASFNVVPMLVNLFQPLFQDNTKMGRVIAFPIRLIWILVGSIFQLIITVPLTLVYLIYLVLPLLPLWAVLEYLEILILFR